MTTAAGSLTVSDNATNVIQISGGWATGQTMTYVTNAGTSLSSSYYEGENESWGESKTKDKKASSARGVKKVRGAKDGKKGKPGQNINPKIFFKFIKSRLSPIEQEDLKRNLNKLSKMIIAAEDMGQQALFEALTVQLATAVREQEAHAVGYDKHLDRKHIERFINRVTDKVIKFEPLERFPRIIPAKIREQIQRVQELGIFDEFHVLYIDYTGEESPKTAKQKQREKDPILFGRFTFQPDTFYYILDWIDKYCDLTISKLIGEIQLDDPEFELGVIPDVSEEYVQSLVAEVKCRAERLKSTNSRNFQDQMAAEEQAHKTRRDASGRFVKKEEESAEPVREKPFMERVQDALRIPFGRGKKGKEDK